MGLDPPVEFSTLCFGDGKVVFRRGDAIPQVLDKLDALWDRECVEVNVARCIAHAWSLPASENVGNSPGAQGALAVDLLVKSLMTVLP
jgi:hypothetical protein